MFPDNLRHISPLAFQFFPLHKAEHACRNQAQLLYLRLSGLLHIPLSMLNSVIVGTFFSFLAVVAQLIKSSIIGLRRALSCRVSPHAASACSYPPNLRAILFLSSFPSVIAHNWLRFGTRPSFSLQVLIALIISSLVIALLKLQKPPAGGFGVVDFKKMAL